MTPTFAGGLAQALSILAPMASSRFGVPVDRFECKASVDSLRGATSPRVTSKTYRPRSQRKRGGRR